MLVLQAPFVNNTKKLPNMTDKPQRDDTQLSFFDRFSRGDSDRARKRAELASEYEEFKKWENERFQNRFASKKFLSKTEGQSYKETIPPVLPALPCVQEQTSQPAEHVESTLIKEYSELGDKVNTKLDELTKKIEALTTSYQKELHTILTRGDVTGTQKKEPEPVSPAKPAGTEGDFVTEEQKTLYEFQLQERLRVLQEAEARLQSLEMEYNRVKRNDQSTPLASSSSDKQVASRLRPHPIDSVGSTLVLGPADSLEQNRVKHENQQRYRQELEQQILEGQQKRKAEAELSKTTDQDTMLIRGTSPTRRPMKTTSQVPEIKSTDPLRTASTIEEQEYFLTGQRDLLAAGDQSLVHNKSPLPPIDSYQKITSPENLVVDRRGKLVSVKDQESKKAQYAQELLKQIEEAKQKKVLQKKQDEEYDRKMEEEFKRYHAYLAQPYSTNPEDNRVVGGHSVTVQPADTLLVGGEDGNFARGGHGIFGNPLSTEQKLSLQKYKEDLAKQIEEKRKREEDARRREEEMELREAERVAAEQLRMQREFEAEQARNRAIAQEAEQHAQTQQLDVERKQIMQHTKALSRAQHQHERCNSPKMQTQQRKQRTLKPRRPHSGDRKHSNNDLLIGPELATKNFSNTSANLYKNGSCEKDRSVIQQLQNLRGQLETEKNRIEEMLHRHQTIDRPGLRSGKYHPKVVRKGESLFRGPYLFDSNNCLKYGIGTVREVSPIGLWGKNALREESLTSTDAQQIAYLKAQDNYLKDLNDELDLMTKRELMNDAILERQKLLGPNEPLSQKAAIEFLMDEPTKDDRRPSSPSQKSIDIDELNEKNQQRLKRLEAIQLLNDIDTDPEAVLQRFVTKHDAVFAPNTK